MVSMSLAVSTLANRIIIWGYTEILFFQRGLNLKCIFIQITSYEQMFLYFRA